MCTGQHESPQLLIRAATADDALAIATAHIHSWRAAYAHVVPATYLAALSIADRAARWAQIIEAGQSTTLVAEKTGLVVAFANFGKCRDAGAPPCRGEIWALYAAPEVWGQGIGRHLMEATLVRLYEKGYSEASLWVLADNERGRRFYGAAGFREVSGSMLRANIGSAELDELLYLRPLGTTPDPESPHAGR